MQYSLVSQSIILLLSAIEMKCVITLLNSCTHIKKFRTIEEVVEIVFDDSFENKTIISTVFEDMFVGVFIIIVSRRFSDRENS